MWSSADLQVCQIRGSADLQVCQISWRTTEGALGVTAVRVPAAAWGSVKRKAASRLSRGIEPSKGAGQACWARETRALLSISCWVR